MASSMNFNGNCFTRIELRELFIVLTAEPGMLYLEATAFKLTRPSEPGPPRIALRPWGGASGDLVQISSGHGYPGSALERPCIMQGSFFDQVRHSIMRDSVTASPHQVQSDPGAESQVNQTSPQTRNHCLGSVACTQAHQNHAHVALDSGLGNSQGHADFLV